MGDVTLGGRFQLPGPAGAGRFIDIEWPAPVGSTAINARTRGGLAGNNLITVTNTAGGGGVQAGVAEFGMETVNFRTLIATDIIATQIGGVSPRTAAGQGVTQDDQAVTRFITVMRLATPAQLPVGDGSKDFGMQAFKLNNGFVGSGVGPGMAVLIRTGNIVTLVIRGPNGLILKDVTGAPFDTTVYHTYEFRFISATLTLAAQFQFFIDGVQIPLPALSSSWGVGTNLPPNAGQGGFVNGYGLSIVNVSGAAALCDLRVWKSKWIAAPTVQDTF